MVHVVYIDNIYFHGCIGTPVSIRKAFARMCMGEGGGDVSCHVRLPFYSQGQLCNWHVRVP